MKTLSTIALMIGSAAAEFPPPGNDLNIPDFYSGPNYSNIPCGGCIVSGYDFWGLWYWDEDRTQSIYGPFQAFDNWDEDDLYAVTSQYQDLELAGSGKCKPVTEQSHPGVYFEYY